MNAIADGEDIIVRISLALIVCIKMLVHTEEISKLVKPKGVP